MYFIYLKDISKSSTWNIYWSKVWWGILKRKKKSLKNDDSSQHEAKNEKSCIIKRNENEYNKLSEKIEEKMKKLKEFAEQSDE